MESGGQQQCPSSHAIAIEIQTETKPFSFSPVPNGQGRAVTSMGSLGFPKTDIERQPQRKVQTDVIKLVLTHRGGGTEAREEGLPNWPGGRPAWLLL